MRTFLLTIFWLSNTGNVIQLLIMTSAGWLIFTSNYSFSDLSLGVFVTQVVTWLGWIETVIVALFDDFGRWVLSIPILIITPIKLIGGVVIGWWAYSTAKDMPRTG